jgi:hypothetical protein
MSDSVFIKNGILGQQTGTFNNIVVQKNGIIRIKKDKPIKKKQFKFICRFICFYICLVVLLFYFNMFKRFCSFIFNRYGNSNCVVSDIKLVVKLIVVIKILLLSFSCNSLDDYLKLLLSF